MPADPVVSPADTIRLRLATINRALYSPETGVTREREAIAAAAALAEWEAEHAALLAVGERDRAEIERLREVATAAEEVLRWLDGAIERTDVTYPDPKGALVEVRQIATNLRWQLDHLGAARDA